MGILENNLLKRLIIYFYLFSTTLIFIYYVKQAPPIIYDQLQYYKLAHQVISNNFNPVTTNYDNRTFVYPTFLALNHTFLSLFGQEYNLFFFYIVNLSLFHISNLFIFKSIEKFSKKIAYLFLFFSSFNVINLGLTNMLLTENLSVVFASLVFYLLTNQQQNYRWFFTLGLTSAFSIFTRPAALIPFLFIALYVISKQIRLGIFKPLIFFLIGSALIFLIATLNVITVTNKFGLFTEGASGLALHQYKVGIYLYKTNTTLDSKFKDPFMQYINWDNYYKISRHCNSPLNCQVNYIKQDLPTYTVMILGHLFSIFDQLYLIDAYVSNTDNVSHLLRGTNYLILSGVLIYIFLVEKRRKIKFFTFLGTLYIGINLLPYLAVPVEPRYSAPIYPIILALFSMYTYHLFKQSTKSRVGLLTLQAIFIISFFAISNQIQSTLFVK